MCLDLITHMCLYLITRDCTLLHVIVKVEPLHLASPNAQEALEDLMRKHHAGRIVARMERHARRMVQVLVDEILHTVPVGKEFPKG